MRRGEACWDILAGEVEEKGKEGRLKRDALGGAAYRKSWKSVSVERKVDDDGGGPGRRRAEPEPGQVRRAQGRDEGACWLALDRSTTATANGFRAGQRQSIVLCRRTSVQLTNCTCCGMLRRVPFLQGQNVTEARACTVTWASVKYRPRIPALFRVRVLALITSVSLSPLLSLPRAPSPRISSLCAPAHPVHAGHLRKQVQLQLRLEVVRQLFDVPPVGQCLLVLLGNNALQLLERRSELLEGSVSARHSHLSAIRRDSPEPESHTCFRSGCDT